MEDANISEMIQFAIVIAVSMLGARMFTTVVHESGHAVMALLLYPKSKVGVYIGSYGDPSEGKHFRAGRLMIHFKYNPFLWNHGVCVTERPDFSVVKNFIITLAGPFATGVIAVTGIWLFAAGGLNDILKLGIAYFIFSAVLDFYYNLQPKEKPIVLYDGTVTMNDGQALMSLIRYGNAWAELRSMSELAKVHKYEEAVRHFEETNGKEKDPQIIRFGIFLMTKTHRIDRAKELLTILKKITTPDSDDHILEGELEQAQGNHFKSIEHFRNAIESNPKNHKAYNARGLAYIELNQYREALADLDVSIKLNSRNSSAYCNRGYAKIKCGQVDDGFDDLLRSVELDSLNPDAYRNLGIYQLEKNNYEKALENFKRAKDLNNYTKGIHDLIDETERLIHRFR